MHGMDQTSDLPSLNLPSTRVTVACVWMGDALCVFKSPPNQYSPHSRAWGMAGRGRVVCAMPWSHVRREREYQWQSTSYFSYLLVRSLYIIALSLCQLLTHMLPSAQARVSVFTSASISAAVLCVCDVSGSELIVNLWSEGLFHKVIHISEILQNIKKKQIVIDLIVNLQSCNSYTHCLLKSLS